MGLACNIDRRGRVARALPGTLLVSATLAWHLASPGASLALHALHLLLGLLGGFMIFEGVVGWCALRALGLRLPL